MGLFQRKQDTQQGTPEEAAAVALLFDDAFREELKDRGRLHFERVINENAALFKQDLDATVAHVNTELRQRVARQLDSQFEEINKVNAQLKEHIAKQLDDRFAEYDKTLREAQDAALQALQRSAQALEEQHRQLGLALERSIASQDAMLTGALEENKARIASIKDAQNVALQSLSQSAQAVQEQHQQLSVLLQKGVSDQQDMLVDAFENNMAQIIEHYLLQAVGDQYDLKAQLPSIIKQMEASKKAIVDDIAL